LTNFTFANPHDGTVEIRDFQTTGVVAFAKGCPISRLQAGKQDIGGHRVQVKEDYRLNCAQAIDTSLGASWVLNFSAPPSQNCEAGEAGTEERE
jgi:hypothetical protein